MSGPWQGHSGDEQGRDHSGNQQSGYGRGPQQGGYQQGGYQQGGHYQGGPNPDQYGSSSAGFDQAAYNRNNFSPGGPNQAGQQGSYSQGGYDQGDYNQGGYNQGGYDQGGYNQGGHYGPPRQRTGLIIGILVGVFLLAGAGVGSYFLFIKKDSPAPVAAGPNIPGPNVPGPGTDPGNTGTPGGASALVEQMKAAIASSNYAALNTVSCQADQLTPDQIQQLADQIQQRGISVSVSVEGVQENGDTATVSYTVIATDPTTGQTSNEPETATLYRNAAGRWIACDSPLTAQDQG